MQPTGIREMKDHQNASPVFSNSAPSSDHAQLTSSPCWLAATCSQKEMEDYTNDRENAKWQQTAANWKYGEEYVSPVLFNGIEKPRAVNSDEDSSMELSMTQLEPNHSIESSLIDSDESPHNLSEGQEELDEDGIHGENRESGDSSSITTDESEPSVSPDDRDSSAATSNISSMDGPNRVHGLKCMYTNADSLLGKIPPKTPNRRTTP
jgi:hypothetical protein